MLPRLTNILLLTSFLLYAHHSYAAEAISRVCDPTRTNTQYTGYRIDRQITLDHGFVKKHETHFSVCKDGSLVNDMVINVENKDDIALPWGLNLCFSNGGATNGACYKMARRKEYVKRSLDAFSPARHIGGLFQLAESVNPKNKKFTDEEYRPLVPLLSDSIFNQWLEYRKDDNVKVYHIPLIYTPDMDGKKYKLNERWYSLISANELYEYSTESINIYRRSFSLLLDSLKQATRNSNKKIQSLYKLTSDAKPTRKAIKSYNDKRVTGNLAHIFKHKIDDLAKERFNKQGIDFSTVMVLSQVLPKDQFSLLIRDLETVYEQIGLNDEFFKYPLSQ
ncbi:hypothetical protein WICPIJ_006982 [Wickerhamomyces pijperi]|uniref:Uncharacterized protein n=1 Tax=Wickerhamomyces pijperi TaxID=599730 RepID=A0A9P8Q114_WICPI|nr:hypothetical protein WICPIJ_006982 [Wickerhamomyces pijperi]